MSMMLIGGYVLALGNGAAALDGSSVHAEHVR